MKTCRTCKFWGPRNFFQEKTLQCLAQCKKVPVYTHSKHHCVYWQKRTGEPLGAGIAKWFFWTTHSWLGWMDEPSICHDMDQDVDDANGVWNSERRDRNWLRRCKVIAKAQKLSEIPAKVGYLIIRAYGRARHAYFDLTIGT